MARKADPGKQMAIVQAATRIFAQKGYTGTLIVEVADAAGVGKGTIYEYFRSKEALFYATFEQIMLETEAQIVPALSQADLSAAQRLTAIADTLISAWMSKIELYGLILEFWSAATAAPGRRRFKDAFKTAYTDFRRVIADVIQAGIDNGEFQPADAGKLASALIGSWDALLLQAWLDPGIDPLGASQAHVKVLLKGLTSPT